MTTPSLIEELVKALESADRVLNSPLDGSYPAALVAKIRMALSHARAAQSAAQKVVTVCGSSRFVDVMAVCAWLIERDENAIAMSLHLLPRWYPNCPDDHLAEAEGVASAMDALHLRKIEMSDEIFVVDVNGYVGSSTSNEIAHATKLGKPVRRFSADDIGRRVSDMLASAKAEAAQSEEWQSIETAPRDGSIFDVWLGDAEHADLNFYCTPGTLRSCNWYWKDGKFRPALGLHTIPTFIVPTHWRPLPSPPSKQEGA